MPESRPGAPVTGTVQSVNGPLITVRIAGVHNGEQVRIGALGLVGEVIGLDGDHARVQAYESTESLHPGEHVEALGHPLTVALGPGLLGHIFDGVQRPLSALAAIGGDHIPRGAAVPALDPQRQWQFQPAPERQPGMRVSGGAVLGTVPETETIEHRILVPPDAEGVLERLARPGTYCVDDPIAELKDDAGAVRVLKLHHRWPVRTPRPYRSRDHAAVPLLTGQRILDTFFPLLKGGKGAVPGPFGAGKTMVQQQIARWADADIVLYVGCGERGNELVDILQGFPALTDPHTGRSLMERTLLVANTSNMPVVAREASIYVGATIAEYYRDQGYDVVLVADSTSCWAEALREVSGRLGQMPVEEGYPAYLASRLAAFYERAGRVQTLGGERGSVTIIGAVSPPGGDFSEPVTSHTKDIVRTFWALSKPLADSRHYPAVDWNDSFSGYVATAADWWADQVDPSWEEKRAKALELLVRADELSRVANLVGPEALSQTQRWVMEAAALIREGLLQQSALDSTDSYASPEKQVALLDLMLAIHRQGQALIDRGIPESRLSEMAVLGRARRVKSEFGADQTEGLRAFAAEVQAAFDALSGEYDAADAAAGDAP